MRVLVTGERGSVGAAVAAFLRRAGWEVAGFDLVGGADVLDLPPCAARLDYFPVDDAHPRRAARPYGLSKRLGEDLCAGFTSRTGIATVCLRPVAVWAQVRDVAAAVGQALTVPLAGHHRILLCAAGIAATAPALDLAARLAPQVPVTSGHHRRHHDMAPER